MYATYFNFILPSLRPYIYCARVECPTGPTLVTALPIGKAARQAPERCRKERVEEYTSAFARNLTAIFRNLASQNDLVVPAVTMVVKFTK